MSDLAGVGRVPRYLLTWRCMLIQPASIDDLPQMVELLSELFSIEQDFCPDPARQEAALRLLLADTRSCVLVARNARGFAIAMVTAQLVISTAEGGLSVWIEDLVVHHDHRGQGVGKALLSAALDWAKCKGATRTQLLVDTNNDPAVSFYDHLKWQETHLLARRMLV